MPLAQAGSWTGNANFLIGQKQLDENDWKPVEDQFELGVLVDFRKVDWPVSIAIDFLGSADVHESGVNKDEGFTFENHIGVRKIWEDTGSAFRPYLGGGVAVLSGKIKRKTGATTVEKDDSGAGFWLGRAPTGQWVHRSIWGLTSATHRLTSHYLIQKERRVAYIPDCLWVITGSRGWSRMDYHEETRGMK